MIEESTDILRALEVSATIPDPFVYLGIIAHLNGERERSRALISEGLNYSRAMGERWFEAYAIYNLGYLESLIGEYEKGYKQMIDGLAIWRSLGDPHYISLGLNFHSPTLNWVDLPMPAIC